MKTRFLDNKYTTWYFGIIYNAKGKERTGYTEKHHIVPKSIGGNNSADNLVVLTAREHFICHWLLTKMVKTKKQKYQMWNAFSCMLYRENNNQERYKVSSHTFENLKKNNSKLKSKLWSGDNNPMYGKTHTDDAKEKISKAHLGKKRSAESKEKMSQAKKGKSLLEAHKQALKTAWQNNKESRTGSNHPMARKCVSPDGVLFNSIKEAAESIGVSSECLRRRIKSDHTHWCYFEGGC